MRRHDVDVIVVSEHLTSQVGVLPALAGLTVPNSGITANLLL
jgi:hypothetical protein